MLRLPTARSLWTTARLDRPSSCHPYLPIAPARFVHPVGHVGAVAPVSGPRVDQINVVVGDVAAAARFLVGLGVDLPSTMPEWETHHRSNPAATSLRGGHDLVEPTIGIDLDTACSLNDGAAWHRRLPASCSTARPRAGRGRSAARPRVLRPLPSRSRCRTTRSGDHATPWSKARGHSSWASGACQTPSTAAPRPIQPRSADPASPSGGSYSATMSIDLSRPFLLK